MANVGIPPKIWSGTEDGEFLSFVVPALDGCNLKCSFCLIQQRQETPQDSLTPDNLEDYIRAISGQRKVVGVAIQGHEPLLPVSRAHTEAILTVAAELGIPSSLVTNGTHLRAALPLLRETGLGAIGISLDSAAPERHDKLRGVAGAWAATVDAIPATVEQGAETGMQVSILSVLLPNRRAYLDEMPALLARLGVTQWIVSPLVAVERDAWAGIASKRRLIDDLLALTSAAEGQDISLIIDDELGLLKPALEAVDHSATSALNIRELPGGVTLSRLSPGGEFSIGVDILRPITRDTVRWDGHSDAAAFYHAARHGQPAEQVTRSARASLG
jgi:pyruvate-formate lyase-activating enzyme